MTFKKAAHLKPFEYKLIGKVEKYQQLVNNTAPLKGVRFDSDLKHCDNCKTEITNILLAIFKQNPPLIHQKIHVLCKECLILHDNFIEFYCYITH